MKPTSTKPRWARRKASVIPGSIVARRPARISLVEIGSRPGAISGPMMPPSMTRVSRGAWRCRARAAARSGTPTPAKTVVSSRSSRAATTARSSDAVTSVTVAGSARPARSVGGPRRGAPRLRSPCRVSFHRAPRGRKTPWVARDEARPGSVLHVVSHSTGLRAAGRLRGWPERGARGFIRPSARAPGAIGGWPETSRAPPPFSMSCLIPPGSARPEDSGGGLRAVRGASFARQLARPALLEREPLAADEVDVVAPRGGGVGVALEVVGHGGRPARVDRPRVVREVVEVRLVEAVALVGERAERRQHAGVDDEARDHAAPGVAAVLLHHGDHLPL